jgi:O-antigen/teichoic acid export membrane protein
MRTNNSLKNIFISILSQVVFVLLGFISRKIFLDSLGADYLGVNGLLTNVLSIMALVESGIGISIVYNLYKPLAEDDRNKIIGLVQLYKKAYSILAIIIMIISFILYPILGHLMKNGSSISHLSIIYFLFVAKNMISYLNAHRLSLINADQKGYVLARVNLIIQVTTTLGRIIILLVTKNYILYLAIELLLYTIQNIINGKIVNKKYPYIKTKEKYNIDKDIKENLMKNVKAMFLHNIGGYLVFGTDNILISSFINIATVGLYSNYTMIIQQLSALVSPILGGVGASVGNLIATESSNKNYSIFKVSFLVNFWIYSFCVIFLFNLLEPFISWWLGKQYLVNNLAFIFILINFYLDGMRTSISTFKIKAGLFVQDKYAPLIEGGINLISSLILLRIYGLAGIFMGTTISTITTILWTQPLIVYKNVFKESVWLYFKRYGYFACVTLITCFIVSNVCNTLIIGHNFMSLVIRGIICVILPNLIYLSIFYKSEEFKYIKAVLGNLKSRLKEKKLIQSKVKTI